MVEGSVPKGASLLVVCQANLVRSPLAAGLLRRRLDEIGRQDLEVASAGTELAAGAVVSRDAAEVARDWGVDITGRLPVPVTASLVTGSGLVMTMTEAQRAAVERRSPGSVPRIFTALELLRLVRGVHLDVATWADLAAAAHVRRPLVPPAVIAEDVPDPVGRAMSFHREVADQLAGACEGIAALAGPGPAVWPAPLSRPAPR